MMRMVSFAAMVEGSPFFQDRIEQQGVLCLQQLRLSCSLVARLYMGSAIRRVGNG